MAKRDYYEVLGVGRSADEKELKSAFRKLAKQHHPDANPDGKASEQKFKEINEAYDVLKDPQKRSAASCSFGARPHRFTASGLKYVMSPRASHVYAAAGRLSSRCWKCNSPLCLLNLDMGSSCMVSCCRLAR